MKNPIATTRAAHACGQQFKVAVAWAGPPLPPAEPAVLPDGRPAPPRATSARTTVCPHVSLRSMALAAAKAMSAIPTAESDAKDTRALQFYVVIAGRSVWTGEPLPTERQVKRADGSLVDTQGDLAVTSFGATADVTASAHITIAPAPAAAPAPPRFTPPAPFQAAPMPVGEDGARTTARVATTHRTTTTVTATTVGATTTSKIV
jgi:hypothetical protein